MLSWISIRRIGRISNRRGQERHLLELSRYVVLNPLRARMVAMPDEWPWSSHRYMIGADRAPDWLATDSLLGHFGPTRSEAVLRYQKFVMAGLGLASPLKQVSHQVLLGDEAFVERHRDVIQAEALRDVNKVQRRVGALSLEEYRSQFPNRDHAMACAYASTIYTMVEIGQFFGVSLRSVSRAVQKFEKDS
jgi:hypothetical protein